MNIGAAIKKLRLERKLTQEELAERANTSKPNISNLERNAQGFSPVILSSLGKAFGVKVSDIFRLAEEMADDEGGESAEADSSLVGSDTDELLALYAGLSPTKKAAMLRFLREWSAAGDWLFHVALRLAEDILRLPLPAKSVAISESESFLTQRPMSEIKKGGAISRKERQGQRVWLAREQSPLDRHLEYYARVMEETWRSPLTVANVRLTLAFFMRYSPLRTLESWQEAWAPQRVFLDLRRERRWSAVTYNSYRKNLLSYFQMLADAGIVPCNPVRRVRKCAEPHSDQPRLTKAQIGPLFEELARRDKGASYLACARNHLFFLLAYYTGARPVELLSLRLGSFSEDRSVVSVAWAKGAGRSRAFELGKDVQDALRAYLRECTLAGRAGELKNGLFLGNRTGTRWQYGGVRLVCRRLSERLGFRVSPYMIRRMVATQLFASRLPIQDIQYHLGHLRASTTIRYVQSHPELNRRGIEVMGAIKRPWPLVKGMALDRGSEVAGRGGKVDRGSGDLGMSHELRQREEVAASLEH